MQTGIEIMKYSDPYTTSGLYYWYRSNANAEIDYAITRQNKIIPIEVKASGKGSMQSMRSFLNTHPDTPYGIRTSMEDFSEYDDIKVYPVYATCRF